MLSQFALEKPGNAEKILSDMGKLLKIYGKHLRSTDATERPYVVMFYGSVWAEDFVTKEKVDFGKGPMKMKEALGWLHENYETVDAYISRYFGSAMEYARAWRRAAGVRVRIYDREGRVDWLPNPPLNVFGPSRARRFL